jgi:hypothetical protein
MLVISCCRQCHGHIEFDEDLAGVKAVCPHCKSDTKLIISRKPLPPTTHKSIGKVAGLYWSLVKPMSEKQTAKFMLELDRLFNEDMKKTHGDAWPAEGIRWKEWMEIQKHRQQENEAKEAFSRFFEKTSGLSPSEIKKSDSDPDWHFFWVIGAAINRDLKIDWVKERLQKAIEQNDLKFFVRFGSALKRKSRLNDFDKVTALLALGWDRSRIKHIPPLSNFTDEALVEILKIYSGDKSLTFDQVRKTRQRLGLKTKDVWVKGIERVGASGFRLIWVDKAEK